MSRSIDKRVRAFTLIEAVISLIIVSAMLVAALTTVGASRLSQQKISSTTRGQLLAEALMAEILQQAYADPKYGGFGLGGDEIGDGNRNLWDDVDDYHGWSSNPPEEKDGTAIPNLAGWTRSVTVEWVDPMDVTQVEVSESKTKRITVTATYNDVPAASLVAIKTAHQFSGGAQ